MFNKVKIGSKLTGGFLIVSLIAALIGIVGFVHIVEIGDHRLPGVQSLLIMQQSQNRILAGERGLLVSMIFDNPSLRNDQFTWMKMAGEKAAKAYDDYDKLPKNREETKIWNKFSERWEEWKKVGNEFLTAARAKETEMNKANSNEELVDTFDKNMDVVSIESQKAFLTASELLDELVQLNAITARNGSRNAKIFMVSLIFIGTIIAFSIGIFLTRSITGPLAKVVKLIQDVGKGQLEVTIDIDREDEIGILSKAMQDMVKQLKNTISYAFEASQNVSSGSLQLSTAAQGISQGSSKQASSVEEISSSIEEISASIEEMTASINQNADNANQTEKIALKSSVDAKDGGEAVQKTVIAMKQIAEKISIVQEIARQTNLLSLNASIEAARAGEHGKGFAVVASAVQKLAERSQDAAEEISKLSKTSVDVAETAGEMLKKLVPDIQKTSELVSEINAASTEQNKGIQQVNSAVQQVNTSIQQFNLVVQSNASASEELASTSEELTAQADELKKRISFFQIEKQVYTQRYDGNTTGRLAQELPYSHSKLNTLSASMHKEKNNQLDKVEREGDMMNGVAIDMSDEDENFQRI